MSAIKNLIKGYGWGPWVYLGFLVFPIASPFLDPHATLMHWLILAGSIGCFLPLHFWAFENEPQLELLVKTVGRRRLIAAGGMTLIGAVGLVFGLNHGASTFLIYAAAYVAMVGRPRLGWALVAGLMLATAGLFLISQIPFPGRWYAFAPAMVFIPIIAGMQIFQNERACSAARLHLAHEEVERLAVIAERERIARDLHDLLGHTLSMITLKSELARKLTKTDPMRAASEMAEVETISRDTLGQVREAVRGYRAKGMAGEIESAKRALKWASVEFDMHADVVDLPPRHETALALALREGVTNIVRHSGATRAKAELKRDPLGVTFTLTDDGGGGGAEGNGLAGIRERVERLDGTFERTYSDGTTLTVRLPVNEHDHPSTPEPNGNTTVPATASVSTRLAAP